MMYGRKNQSVLRGIRRVAPALNVVAVIHFDYLCAATIIKVIYLPVPAFVGPLRFGHLGASSS